MSGKLVGEVVDWLRTPAAAGLTPNERFVLMLIAERAHDKTRDMWRHKADTETLAERMAACIGITPGALGDILARLAGRGLEARVPLAVDKKGRVVFATRGRATRFRLPELPASVSLPTAQWSGEDRTITEPEPVDNSAPETPENGSGDEEWSGQDRTKEANGPARTGPNPPNGPVLAGPYPYKELPSNKLPSSPVDPSSLAELEDAAPLPTIEDDEKFDLDEYRLAQGHLLAVPNAMDLIARIRAAHPAARHEVHVIHAARLAAKGIPA